MLAHCCFNVGPPSEVVGRGSETQLHNFKWVKISISNLVNIRSKSSERYYFQQYTRFYLETFSSILQNIPCGALQLCVEGAYNINGGGLSWNNTLG